MNLSDDIIIRFLDACYDAGIKSPERFILSKMPQVYGWLKGAFPRGILPTDVDGEVELNGYFLRLEFKHDDALRNGRVPRGQMMCFQRLAKTGYFTIMLIGVNQFGEPSCFEMWHRDKISKLEETTSHLLRARCAAWAKWADGQPRLT